MMDLNNNEENFKDMNNNEIKTGDTNLTAEESLFGCSEISATRHR
jgi:hypothetical protein